MADRNINEKIRKPRRTKGTPFFVQRNYYAAAVLAAGGFCWFLYELWPASQKLKTNLLEGKKLQDSDAVEEHFARANLSLREPGLQEVLTQLIQRENTREDELYQDPSKPKPWYVEIFTSEPEL